MVPALENQPLAPDHVIELYNALVHHLNGFCAQQNFPVPLADNAGDNTVREALRIIHHDATQLLVGQPRTGVAATLTMLVRTANTVAITVDAQTLALHYTRNAVQQAGAALNQQERDRLRLDLDYAEQALAQGIPDSIQGVVKSLATLSVMGCRYAIDQQDLAAREVSLYESLIEKSNKGLQELAKQVKEIEDLLGFANGVDKTLEAFLFTLEQQLPAVSSALNTRRVALTHPLPVSPAPAPGRLQQLWQSLRGDTALVEPAADYAQQQRARANSLAAITGYEAQMADCVAKFNLLLEEVKQLRSRLRARHQQLKVLLKEAKKLHDGLVTFAKLFDHAELRHHLLDGANMEILQFVHEKQQMPQDEKIALCRAIFCALQTARRYKQTKHYKSQLGDKTFAVFLVEALRGAGFAELPDRHDQASWLRFYNMLAMVCYAFKRE